MSLDYESNASDDDFMIRKKTQTFVDKTELLHMKFLKVLILKFSYETKEKQRMILF